MGRISLDMIYAFALTDNLKVLLYQLKSPDLNALVASRDIEDYLNLLIKDQPSYIIGLGSYSGVDRDKIRIERITSNSFRNNKIEEDLLDKLKIDNFLTPDISNKNLKFADALGNSWCNLISWKIMRLIKNKTLNSRYSFLHIPKSFNLNLATQEIENLLHPLVS